MHPCYAEVGFCFFRIRQISLNNVGQRRFVSVVAVRSVQLIVSEPSEGYSSAKNNYVKFCLYTGKAQPTLAPYWSIGFASKSCWNTCHSRGCGQRDFCVQ